MPDWYQFMGAAATAVAGANSDALIIAGGSDSESLLAYVATQPLLPPDAPGHECGPKPYNRVYMCATCCAQLLIESALGTMLGQLFL